MEQRCEGVSANSQGENVDSEFVLWSVALRERCKQLDQTMFLGSNGISGLLRWRVWKGSGSCT